MREDARGRGIGQALLRALIVMGVTEGFHTLVGRICEENRVSCHLAERTGFQRAGVMAEVGCKFGRWLNVAIYQMKLDP